MAQRKLTEYERKRLDNIRRNEEMIVALKLHSKASALSKRPRVGNKSHSVKPKTETLVVTRRSLRTRGIQPDVADSRTGPPVITSGPFPIKNVYRGTDSDTSFIQSLAGTANSETPVKTEGKGSLELESLSLDPNNIARVVPGKITEVRFFPSSNVKMIVAGNTFGGIGFWNVEERTVFLYHPHRTLISGISVHPHCLSKIYTSCYDGFVRLMDAEKEIFDMVYISDECIYSLSQPKNEANCLYFSEGSGVLTVCDNRMAKCSSRSVLHGRRINTIDFNPENPHIVATGSSDGTACTWDLRCNGGSKFTPLRTFTHERALQSAYFSPSGCILATTSTDHTIGIHGGVNMEDVTFVYRRDNVGWSSTFRAIWGWDDSYLYIGNTNRGVDVVSTVQKARVMTLQSPHLSAIPCRLDSHSYEVGMLAGATSGGRVYVWTSS